MSKLSTVPVMNCKRCGQLIQVQTLSTTAPDTEGDLLFEIFKSIYKEGLCPNCRRQYNYYAQQNRVEDFWAGRP